MTIRRVRRSHHVNRRQAETFFPAIKFAEALGRPLNLFVTINFAHTACRPEAVSAAFERLRDNHFTRWLRYVSRRGKGGGYGPPTYVWVLENDAGYAHIHWMVHVPAALRKRFETKVVEWVARVAGPIRCVPSAISLEEVTGSGGLGRYLMKGINPHVPKHFHVRPDPQGVVHGKRCGVSECLGPAARGRHGSRIAARPRRAQVG